MVQLVGSMIVTLAVRPARDFRAPSSRRAARVWSTGLQGRLTRAEYFSAATPVVTRRVRLM